MPFAAMTPRTHRWKGQMSLGHGHRGQPGKQLAQKDQPPASRCDFVSPVPVGRGDARRAGRAIPPPRRPHELQQHLRHRPPVAVRPAGRRRLPPIPAAPRTHWSRHRRSERRRHRQGGHRDDPQRLGRAAAPAVWLATWRRWAPGRCSCPCATERRPVGRFPRLGRVELRLGPAWVRYRETATPETGSPSVFHRPVMVPCRHRARSSRLRVMLPRCRPPRRCPPAARPTAPIYPARVRLLLRCPRLCVAGAVPVRPAACSGTRPCALLGPAVPHRVAD
jgi:hypothetical protein